MAPGFFGDGNTAIVLQNNDGSVALWDMSGTTVVGGGLVANPGPTWHVKGTGVFFADGNTGIVLQNDDGSVALWDMSGTSIIGGGLVANPGPTWHIEGTGNFFGDGNNAILFQNDDGSVALWDMNGTSIVGGGLVAEPRADLAHQGHGQFLRRRSHRHPLSERQRVGRAVGHERHQHYRRRSCGVNPGPTWHIKGTGDFSATVTPTSPFKTTMGRSRCGT